MNSILITGAAGVVGTVLARGLRETYDLSGVDRKRTRHLRSSVADTRQFDEIAPLFEGKDAVVDLAAAASPSLSWDDAVRNNIASTRNVLEAALHASVPRVVFASSNRVTGLYERDSPYAEIVAGAYERLSPHDIPYIRVDQPVRPDGPVCGGESLWGSGRAILRRRPRPLGHLRSARDGTAARPSDAPAPLRDAVDAP